MVDGFSLVIGCGGQKYSDFQLCAGTFNVLVNFDQHIEPESLEKVMDFLDTACKLFDTPVGDWNKIVNIAKILRENFGLIDNNTWQALYIWFPQHKKCGAYLKLIFNTELNTYLKKQEEADISIISVNKQLFI